MILNAFNMVSIVLVTYNRAERLKLSIQDILKQTFTEFELIICDDCSPDHTEEICREFAAKDSRIKYFRHASNKEMPGNCNFGIMEARYSLVAILHDGDRFREDLIQKWYNAISKNDSVGFVFNSIAETDEYDNTVNVICEFPEGIIKGETLLKSVFFRRPHLDSPVYGEAMVRKNLIMEYGLIKNEFGFYADVDLWMELLHKHDAYYCADAIIFCPQKSVQPNEFKDDIIKFNMYMVSMHLKHRKKAFSSSLPALAKEMVIGYSFALYHTTYSLLLVIKNYTFKYFITSAKHLVRQPVLFLPWAILLFLYPVGRVTLRTLAILIKKF